MIDAINLAILIGAVLVVIATFTSLISFRLGAPLLLVFLLVGLAAGENGLLGIHFNNAGAAYFIGSTALAVILFDSGFGTPLTTLRLAAGPSLMLSTVGVLATTGLTAAAAHWLFAFGWGESFLIGALLSPTDAAAVFFLLRVGGITLRERVRATLEVESGSNDPMAIFLTIGIIELVAGHGDHTVTHLLLDFVLEIGLGLIFGVVGGFILVAIINRTDFEPGLYPIVMLALALTLFSLTSLAGGSGFLAVYAAGLIAGNSRMRHTVAVRRFADGMTWLAQIAMFLTLGLLATPVEFPAVLAPALGLSAVLILIARPVAVWLCLLPFGFNRYETAFVGWVGLRGAVSILLGTLPLMMAIDHGKALFNIAFIAVLVSLVVQGWSIAPVARWLRLTVPPRIGPVNRIELELPGRGDHEIVAYQVHPESPVARGERMPRWARPSLIVRDGRSLRPHSAGRPRPGDQIYIVTATDYVGLLDRLFAAPAPSAVDPALYGEFALDPEVTLGELAAMYDLPPPPADADMTARAFMRRELAGTIEPGDRVPVGPVDLVVRRVTEAYEIAEVGLAVAPEARRPPRLPLFQSRRDIAEWLKRYRQKRLARAAGAGAGAGAAVPAAADTPPPPPPDIGMPPPAF